MCDQGCAVQSVLAVLMALYWRERTGEGQLVDTSIVNAGVHFNTDAWIGPDGWTERPRTDQQQTGLGPFYRLYPTIDGWLALACLGRSHRAVLAKVVPGLDDDDRAADVLGAFLARRTAQDAFDLLDGAGVPVEIADPDGGRTWFSQPDLVAAGLVADYQHPAYGRFRQFGHLVHLSATPGRIAGPPPLLGQHSREVLAELGYSADEIEGLRERGVTLWPD
jgi:crotonobetainyl-CoA:carnitine CoA-transferase CaiB-like acyl-CoA transferase